MFTKSFRVVGSVLASLLPLFAEPFFAEDFATDPGYVGAKGPNDNNESSLAIGAPGSRAPYLMPGQFGGTSQYLTDAQIEGSTSKGAFTIGTNADLIQGKSRMRSYLTWIDTSKTAVGQYEVTFDIRDLSVKGDAVVYFHLYEGGGTDNGFVEFRVTNQVDLPALVSTRPSIKTGKGATAGWVVTDQKMTSDGKFRLSFGLSETGRPGDYLALVWSQVKLKGSAQLPSMTIDNLVVEKLKPSPSSETPEGTKPVGQEGAWSIVSSFSDEFDSKKVDSAKWNNNPGSWGAWSWDEKNTFIDSGELHIQMVHEPHIRNQTQLFYRSGILRSHGQMTYGYYEARIKGCALFPGACPAFWTYSDGKQQSGEVRYSEVDFVELQMNELDQKTKDRNAVNHLDLNLHVRVADEGNQVRWIRPNIDPDLCANHWMAPWDPRDDFHVYGCEVGREEIIWFVDGTEVARKANRYWHLPMNVTLSLGLRHPHIGWVGQDIKPVPKAATGEGFPTAMEVDYVRVWTRQ